MRVIILSVYRFAQNALKRWFKSEMFTSYRISWPLNPFPLTHLRPEVELMYLLPMRNCAYIIVTKVAENGVAPEMAASLQENMCAEFKYGVRF